MSSQFRSKGQFYGRSGEHCCSAAIWSSCFVVLLTTIAYTSTCSKAATLEQDVEALKNLHMAWLGNPRSWDLSTDPCEQQWLGIRCDGSQTRVTQILLINQGLAGTLSASLGNLTSLTDMDISSNPILGGPLPAEIGSLINMERFFALFCNLSGLIPSEIGNMINLVFVGLSQNSFTGPLPATVGLLKNLIWFDVSSNNLSGSLPVSSSSGIGSGLDNLTKAQHLHLQNNEFSEAIPGSLFVEGMELVHLLLNNNKLSGSIPPTIANLVHLQILSLDDNALSGALPSVITSLPNLTTLQVNNNNLNGQLPDLSSNLNLQLLIAGHNAFEASEIPSWITKMKNLYLLSLDSANLTGSVPAEIFGFSSVLSNMSLGSNHLTGTLNLTEARSLLFVNFTDNDIISLEKGNYTQKLLMDGNPYCKIDPAECTLFQASTPEAPAMSVACPNACALDYAINKKNSSSCQCAYPVVSICTFEAAKFPSLLNLISKIEHIFVSGLSGSQYLEGVAIQDTQVIVDVLSTYALTVSVFPPSNATAWSLNIATDISYAIQNKDIDFAPIGAILCKFTGNSYLEVARVVTKLSTGAIVGIVIGLMVFTVVIFVVVLYAMKMKQRALKAERLNKPFASWIVAGQENSARIPQLKGARPFSLGELRNSTNNFSQSNEIGEGGYGKVYKAFLSSGERVAIKRASANSLQGAAEFKNEIELLSRVHHRNLVGLIGFCYEEGEQILVYEYMPNGTLRDCLSGRTGLRMDWSRRIDLALGSARGIAYLHTEANPPIIHRDIKSSNILLDEGLVAKVADFGLSKLALDGGLAVETTEVKGTFGYLDPNYFTTNQLTTKSDVYSFGVVLFEMITGRLAIQGGKCIAHEVAKLHAEGGIDLVVQEWVDPNLGEYPGRALGLLLEIALNCVKDDPQERFSMAEVVKELEALVSPASGMDTINMNEKRIQLEEQVLLPYSQGSYGSSSFKYSGSFISISTPFEPK